jgi:membrane-associated phospholipid phosphatase
MLARIRQRIGERLLKRESGEAGTPVAPLVPGRPTLLFLVIAAASLCGVALLLWAQGDIDRLILVAHNSLRTDASMTAIFKFISGYGMSLIVFVVLAHLVLVMRFREVEGTHRVYLLIILSYGIGGITGDVLKEILDRPRPFFEYADQVMALSRPRTPSLPSGHATKSMALALPFVIFVSNERGWSRLMRGVVLLVALAVGYARVMLGVHYLSDVLAGIGVALACLPLAVWAANRICRRVTREKLDTLVKVWGVILFFLMLYLLTLS